MAVQLPLPYQVADEATQANFDALAQNFPLSEKHLKIETPHLVGATDEPAFQNSWVNYGTTYQVVRFWKDPLGMVHVEGLIKDGTISTTLPVFTLPVGYRPAGDLIFPADTNASAHGRAQVMTNGNVVPYAGSNGYFSLTQIMFRQEA